MKKKVVFIIIYLLICVAPFATLWLNVNDTSSSEKRELAAFPQVTKEGRPNTAFFTEFDAWFSDHMGGRSLLIEAQTAMKEYVFAESAESSIILGRNNWLFYEKTTDDYCHVRTLSARNTENVAYTLRMLQDYCAELGAEFVFTVAPNKNTLYADNMPARFVKIDGPGNLDALTEALGRYGVNYADIKKAFQEDPRVLYHPRDSHWTYEGAFLGYRTIMGALKPRESVLTDMTYTERMDWDSDLMNMLYPNAPDDDRQVYPNITYTFETKSADIFDEALVIETYGGPGEGTVLMFRDSFGNTSWRYFAQTFEKAEFQRAVPYRMSSVDRLGADAVILEIVERNLINLAEKAPMMAAPVVELDILDAYDMSAGENLVESEKVTGFYHVYGYVDRCHLGDTYRAYIITENEGKKTFYEAFPIYEKELLGAERTDDNGFSAYIPEEEEGHVIGVLIETAGQFYVKKENR